MTTLHISLPEQATQFVSNQVASGQYHSPSEFISILVEDARVKAAKDRLAELICEGMNSGDGVEYSDEWWEQQGDEIRAEAKRQGFL
jgi:antitoxin ParD1/3/4